MNKKCVLRARVRCARFRGAAQLGVSEGGVAGCLTVSIHVKFVGVSLCRHETRTLVETGLLDG